MYTSTRKVKSLMTRIVASILMHCLWVNSTYLHDKLQIVVYGIQKCGNCQKDIVTSCLQGIRTYGFKMQKQGMHVKPKLSAKFHHKNTTCHHLYTILHKTQKNGPRERESDTHTIVYPLHNCNL